MASPHSSEAVAAIKRHLARLERNRAWYEAEFLRPLMLDFFHKLRTKMMWLQRPRTDDMMQMCMDLGVDVPDFQPVSFDGMTFKWMTKEVSPMRDEFAMSDYGRMTIISKDPWK